MNQHKRPGAAKPVTFERGRGVYRVDASHGLAHVVVTVGEDEGRAERLQTVLQTLADRCIPIFLIKLHRTAVSFAVDSVHVPRAEECLCGVAGECVTRPDLSLVTVVATSMRDLTGVMVTIADSLQRAGARIYGMGDSHNSVQVLLDTAHGKAAVRELCVGFGLEVPA